MLRLNQHELAQLARLAVSRDPLPSTAHSTELLRRICQAYYAGQLAPLQLTKEDEELLLALARGAEVAALGSEANLAALGAKRIATEVSKRLAFGLGKELQLNLAPGVEAPWQGWLPLPLRGNALVLRKIAEAELTLVLGTEWQYPVEAECRKPSGEAAANFDFRRAWQELTGEPGGIVHA
ncbi:unnamed protein product [Effrenium voratum]|nr:unnamed protein product [Effrenium voratum]